MQPSKEIGHQITKTKQSERASAGKSQPAAMAHCTVQSADWATSFKTTCYCCIVMTVRQLHDWWGCKSPYRAIKRSAGAGQGGCTSVPTEAVSGIADGGLQALVMRDMLNSVSGPDYCRATQSQFQSKALASAASARPVEVHIHSACI